MHNFALPALAAVMFVGTPIHAEDPTSSYERMVANIEQQLMEFEGFEQYPYEDGGKFSIGYGHQIQPGETYKRLTKEQARAILAADIDKSYDTVKRIYPDIDTHPTQVRVACVHMVFQLGPTGFAQFVNLRKALTLRRYKDCAKEALASRWYRQTPKRATYVAKLFMESTTP